MTGYTIQALTRLSCFAAVAAIAFCTMTQPSAAEGDNYPLPQQKPAKQVFGQLSEPANLAPQSVGSYAKGCLAGGEQLASTGSNWQAMRLSRNRHWGHPALVAYLERFSSDAVRLDDWPGLLVGDMSQPRGGPMLSGHASHQIGLDADIWMLPSPGRELSRQEREDLSSISMISGRRDINPETWTEGHARLLRRAASYPQVARIFVHPAIKKALCEWEQGDRSWLRVVRPWYGHHYHFHVRLSCPEDSADCRNQAVPPAGDGCGSELSWWLSDEPYAPSDDSQTSTPRTELTLDDLPNYCTDVVNAAARQ